MRKVSYTQTNTLTWAASSTVAADVDRTGLITRIDLTLEITPSGALSTNVVDGLWRALRNFRILGGSHTYFHLPDDAGGQGGTLLHYLNRLDGFGLGHIDNPITAPNRTYSPVHFVLHCGSRPRDAFGRDNPFDLTAFIPAVHENQLRAEWVTTTAANTIDDTVTISSAVARLTLHMVQGTEQEIREEMARQGVQMLMKPDWSTEPYAPTATAADYSLERDVPLGGWLKRIGVLAQDASAIPLRASDEVTGLALKLPYQNETLIKVFADSLMAKHGPGSVLEGDDAALDFGNHAPKGIFVLDLRPHSVRFPDYGLDLRGLQTGAVKLGITNTVYASGDDFLILYERYLPYEGPLGSI